MVLQLEQFLFKMLPPFRWPRSSPSGWGWEQGWPGQILSQSSVSCILNKAINTPHLLSCHLQKLQQQHGDQHTLPQLTSCLAMSKRVTTSPLSKPLPVMEEPRVYIYLVNWSPAAPNTFRMMCWTRFGGFHTYCIFYKLERGNSESWFRGFIVLSGIFAGLNIEHETMSMKVG